MDTTIPTEEEVFYGWNVEGTLVHPVCAYISERCWMDSFLHQFPDKAKRMREYDEKHGYTPVVFYKRWIPVTINWLNKNYARRLD